MSDQLLQPVRHCEDTSRFVLRLDADSEAVLKYKRESDSVLDLFSTVVPKQFEGRGLGKVLASAAFDHVRDNGLKMRLSCWYLRALIDKEQFSKYKHLST